MGLLKFQVIEQDQNARTGLLQLKHGKVHTPELMPVATKATVKALSSDDLNELGAQLLICNTYHLMLQPNADIIAEMGGLHTFMNWNKPLITDSGGFQAFSLGIGKEHAVGKMYFPGNGNLKNKSQGKSIVKVTDKGIEFRSIYDNSFQYLTPEDSTQMGEEMFRKS
jgi:tRNA-guanine family transglycosylase